MLRLVLRAAPLMQDLQILQRAVTDSAARLPTPADRGVISHAGRCALGAGAP